MYNKVVNFKIRLFIDFKDDYIYIILFFVYWISIEVFCLVKYKLNLIFIVFYIEL